MFFTDATNNNVINESDIIQESHYYAFGMDYESYPFGVTSTPNKYQYNGKELNGDFGLNMMDYGARWYDATIGRWTSIDPLAEKYRRWSPYNYGINNPIRFIDPDGMALDDIIIKYSGDMTADEKESYAKNVLRTLQNLTNDKLKLDGNKIVIEEKNEGSSKQNATNLIRGFIEGNDEHKQDVTFVKSKDNQKKSTTLPDRKNENNKRKSSIISYDFNSTEGRGYYAKNSDTKEQKKIANHETAILHELIHAENIATNNVAVGICINCVRTGIRNEEAKTQATIRNIYQPENSQINLTEDPYKND